VFAIVGGHLLHFWLHLASFCNHLDSFGVLFGALLGSPSVRFEAAQNEHLVGVILTPFGAILKPFGGNFGTISDNFGTILVPNGCQSPVRFLCSGCPVYVWADYQLQQPTTKPLVGRPKRQPPSRQLVLHFLSQLVLHSQGQLVLHFLGQLVLHSLGAAVSQIPAYPPCCSCPAICRLGLGL
jgi:hypothetical protein